jgi:7-cyano-7-deazaguanine synthase in queuosine biosynthesis
METENLLQVISMMKYYRKSISEALKSTEVTTYNTTWCYNLLTTQSKSSLLSKCQIQLLREQAFKMFRIAAVLTLLNLRISLTKSNIFLCQI